MSSKRKNSRQGNTARRQWLIAIVALAFVAGCGKPAAPVAEPFLPPAEFADSQGSWEYREGEPTQSDNALIGSFFEKNPSLIGSPEWTGKPEKYVATGSSGLLRFYWFSGNADNPSWNALEFSGGRMRQLSGVGSPNTESEG